MQNIKMKESVIHSNTMPALFLGHGRPMNAMEENEKVTLSNDRIVAGSLSMTCVRSVFGGPEWNDIYILNPASIELNKN